MKKFILLVLALCFTLCLSIDNNNIVSAATTEADKSLSVEIIGETPTEIVPGINTIAWKDMTSFNVTVNGLNIDDIYSFNWIVYYKQAKYDGTPIEDGAKVTFLNNEQTLNSLSYNINTYNQNNTDATEYPVGWGIYMFKLQYFYTNGGESYELSTETFEVTPTPITAAPTITYEIVSNSQSQLNGFIFKVVDDSVYEFCDGSKIQWHASAIIDNIEWKLEDHYEAPFRMGKVFTFMPTDQAEFTVYATVEGTTNNFVSDSKIVSTIRPTANMTLVIVISVVVLLVAIGILTASIVISIKREKVW